MTNYKERQPLVSWDRVEVPSEVPGEMRIGRYIDKVDDYWTKIQVNSMTYFLPPQLAEKLRRPFDVGDVVMCSFGSTTVAGKIVERGAWGELFVQRYDNNSVIPVSEGNMSRMDKPWMSVEELKSRFPKPPFGMFWDLTANVDEDGSGDVVFEVCLNVDTYNKVGVHAKYSSVVWEEGMSEFEVFEAVLAEAENLSENFPEDIEKFLRAQKIGFDFGVLRG